MHAGTSPFQLFFGRTSRYNLSKMKQPEDDSTTFVEMEDGESADEDVNRGEEEDSDALSSTTDS